MHKTDLIKAISKEIDLSSKDVTRFLNSFQSIVTTTLKKGETIALIGFGSFKVIKTAARNGRNPQTGKEVKIKAGKRVKFVVGKSLKEAVIK